MSGLFNVLIEVLYDFHGRECLRSFARKVIVVAFPPPFVLYLFVHQARFYVITLLHFFNADSARVILAEVLMELVLDQRMNVALVSYFGNLLLQKRPDRVSKRLAAHIK